MRDLPRREGVLLGSQQGFEHSGLVGQGLGKAGGAHALGGAWEGLGSAARHAAIIPGRAM